MAFWENSNTSCVPIFVGLINIVAQREGAERFSPGPHHDFPTPCEHIVLIRDTTIHIYIYMPQNMKSGLVVIVGLNLCGMYKSWWLVVLTMTSAASDSSAAFTTTIPMIQQQQQGQGQGQGRRPKQILRKQQPQRSQQAPLIPFRPQRPVVLMGTTVFGNSYLESLEFQQPFGTMTFGFGNSYLGSLELQTRNAAMTRTATTGTTASTMALPVSPSYTTISTPTTTITGATTTTTAAVAVGSDTVTSLEQQEPSPSSSSSVQEEEVSPPSYWILQEQQNEEEEEAYTYQQGHGTAAVTRRQRLEMTTTRREGMTVMVKEDDETKEKEENLLKKIKEAGMAGIISFGLVQLGFWAASAVVVLWGYVLMEGHLPDWSSQDEMAMLGAGMLFVVVVVVCDCVYFLLYWHTLLLQQNKRGSYKEVLFVCVVCV